MRVSRKRIVIALGGNAITLPHHKGTYKEQFSHVRSATHHILEFVKRGFEVVLTHGNGPQVGNLLVQQEFAASHVPPQPMDTCNAMTQGQLGYVLQQCLVNELKAQYLDLNVVTMLTQTLVSRDDPAFTHPSKPVGPFYDHATKKKLEDERGYQMRQVAADSEPEPFRRVVPSPDPLWIVEVAALKKLVDAGMIVIASGGGGIPVVATDRGELVGVDGVVDKDLTAEKLAEAVCADIMMILTDVSKVKLSFGTPSERDIDRMTVTEAKEYLEKGEFAAGSMAPKIIACTRFIEYGGEDAVITSLDRAWPAVQNQDGTHIRP